jgi:hypothetical protein
LLPAKILVGKFQKKRYKGRKIKATKIAGKMQSLIAIKAKETDSSAEPISL